MPTPEQRKNAEEQIASLTQLHEKAAKATRYTDFREGLARTIDWYRDTEAWWAPQKDATEAKYRAAGQA